jgi:hypothetical protein
MLTVIIAAAAIATASLVQHHVGTKTYTNKDSDTHKYQQAN